MPARPYFSISRHSFEKNAGYKSTVHALAELIDNAFEAEASGVTVVLQVDRRNRLETIAVCDDGKGMSPDLLQMAVCEKAGSYVDRQRGAGPGSRRKLGKYGVGLPKASISQCNRFTVWSWTDGLGSASRNGIDITDEDWIDLGAEVDESASERPPPKWLRAAGLEDSKSGTVVLWEDLDGVTWSRARWGDNSGLIPNLEFEVGRVYRRVIAGAKPEFNVEVLVVDGKMEGMERVAIGTNDPLYATPGASVPREILDDGSQWPPDDPLFDDISRFLPYPSLDIEVPRRDGDRVEVKVDFRASAAKRDTFARLNGRNAGSLLHGQHAKRNVGLSVLREGREISMSMALSQPSEPRERWFGVEIDLPHELDVILGMTNNKQEYTRLERVLSHEKSEYQEPSETTQECLNRIGLEDPDLAICLRIAWAARSNWTRARETHMNMREDVIRRGDHGEEGATVDPSPAPEEEAEVSASGADDQPSEVPTTEEGRERAKSELEGELGKAGVPEPEARQIAARVVDRGLTYTIVTRRGLGSPFFSVTPIRGVRLIQLNEDHPAYPYFRSSIGDELGLEGEDLERRLENSRVALLLMLEAWGKLEIDAEDGERRGMQRMREDWGRLLERFIGQLRQDRAKRGAPEK